MDSLWKIMFPIALGFAQRLIAAKARTSAEKEGAEVLVAVLRYQGNKMAGFITVEDATDVIHEFGEAVRADFLAATGILLPATTA